LHLEKNPINISDEEEETIGECKKGLKSVSLFLGQQERDLLSKEFVENNRSFLGIQELKDKIGDMTEKEMKESGGLEIQMKELIRNETEAKNRLDVSAMFILLLHVASEKGNISIIINIRLGEIIDQEMMDKAIAKMKQDDENMFND
jgi:hypothetical protein